jgi:hypothetical protein
VQAALYRLARIDVRCGDDRLRSEQIHAIIPPVTCCRGLPRLVFFVAATLQNGLPKIEEEGLIVARDS